MANDASIGRHTMQQVQRLERNLSRLSGGEFKLPDHNRYGKEFLLIDQLKAVNVCLEGMLGETVIETEPAPEPEVNPSEVPTDEVAPVAAVEDEPMVAETPEEVTPDEPESVDESEPVEEVVSPPKSKNKGKVKS